MDSTRSFRRTLCIRILQASALSLPFAAALAGGCGGGGSGGAGGGRTEQSCFAWPEGDAGTACPSQSEATMYLSNVGSSSYTVLTDGTYRAGYCCYEVDVENSSGLLSGRPYVEGAAARTAVEQRGAPAGAWSAAANAPRVDGLSPAQRARLAAAWTTDGLVEHASIAAFGRVALELLAAGAPADLLAETHRAALDEIEHARLCLSLAGAYAGEPVAPAPFPFDGRVEVSADLPAIAARAVREGCIGETLAAVQAAEQLARAEDPAVRAALARIAEDESRHAALAWRTVAWALRQGGAPVRAAVEEAFAAPLALPAGDADADDAVLAAHGRLDAPALRAAVARAMGEIVRPCAAALLAG